MPHLPLSATQRRDKVKSIGWLAVAQGQTLSADFQDVIVARGFEIHPKREVSPEKHRWHIMARGDMHGLPAEAKDAIIRIVVAAQKFFEAASRKGDFLKDIQMVVAVGKIPFGGGSGCSRQRRPPHDEPLFVDAVFHAQGLGVMKKDLCRVEHGFQGFIYSMTR